MILAITTLFAFLEMSSDGSAPWWNYPGLELWKFVNLLVFILVLRLLVGKKLKGAMQARAGAIKQELQTAREERDSALAKLAEVEGRIARLDQEAAAIREKAQTEAEAEKQRLRADAEKEIVRIREQATREIDSATKAAKHELRKYAAQESVRLAENILSREIRPEDDARLSELNVQELGRIQG